MRRHNIVAVGAEESQTEKYTINEIKYTFVEILQTTTEIQ